MGLDISFFERVEFVGPHASEWVDEKGVPHYCDHLTVYVSGQFPRTELSADLNGIHFDATERLHWYASYVGYSMFRACLLHTVRPDLVTATNPYYPRLWTDEISDGEFESWPFNELIWFSDCEGDYGPDVAAKLLEDFRQQEHLIKASAHALWPQQAERFVDLYHHYTEGLELVGPSGLVHYS